MWDIEILFIGGVFPREIEADIIEKSKNNVQLAANNFQWDLINGLDAFLKRPVTIISEMFINSYPKNYKDAYVKKYNFSHAPNAKDICLGLINVSIIKQFIHPFHEKKNIREWFEEHDGKNAVFIYSLNVKFVRICKYIKKISPETPIIISVMDLPEHIMKSKDSNIFVKIWKNYLIKKVYEGLKYVDGCMVVAEKQIDRIPKNASDCVLVESIANSVNRKYTPIKYDGKKRIVYAGTLAKQYNILNLLSAFKKISDPNVMLIICGDGDTKDEIIRESQEDSRIKYLGVLPRNEVIKIMESAWVLVNPRENKQDFTNYSFPSKTIDYLLAGRPIICQKLEAIPQEYDNHLIYFKNSKDNIELTKKMNSILEMELHIINNIGFSNYKFAIEEKCASKQIPKILNLINSKYSI